MNIFYVRKFHCKTSRYQNTNIIEEPPSMFYSFTDVVIGVGSPIFIICTLLIKELEILKTTGNEQHDYRRLPYGNGNMIATETQTTSLYRIVTQ